MWKKKDTAVFRWEIRNISIFITATWKTLECLHPLQQATQRKLAWGQISVVRWPKKERERPGEGERELKVSNKSHSWTFTIQTWWGLEDKHCIWDQANQTTYLTLIGWIVTQTRDFESGNYFWVLNKHVKSKAVVAIYPNFVLVTITFGLHEESWICKWFCTRSNCKLTTSLVFPFENISVTQINKKDSVNSSVSFHRLSASRLMTIFSEQTDFCSAERIESEGAVGGRLWDVTKPGCWCEVILRTQINTTCTYTLLLISPL